MHGKIIVCNNVFWLLCLITEMDVCNFGMGDLNFFLVGGGYLSTTLQCH